MKTLAEVKDRCIIVAANDSDDRREHWVYQGACVHNTPRIHAPDFTRDPSGRTLKTQAGRRAVHHIQTGLPLAPGVLVWSRCTVPRCVNPDCAGVGKAKAKGRARQRSGIDRGAHNRIMANRRNASSQRKVTRAVADDILQSNDSNLALAARHGLHKETISRVRRGLTQAPGSIFQGLMR